MLRLIGYFILFAMLSFIPVVGQVMWLILYLVALYGAYKHWESRGRPWYIPVGIVFGYGLGFWWIFATNGQMWGLILIIPTTLYIYWTGLIRRL